MQRNAALQYLTREGNLRVPASRYGHDSESCAVVAYVAALIAADASGEGMTEASLEHMMGLVVNNSDYVEYLIRMYGPALGFDPNDYLPPLTSTADAIEAARELGAEHGENAASWYFDGNTPGETYLYVLRGIIDGDPAILDTFPSSPLSGEWADGMIPRDVLDAIDYSTPEEQDEILAAYEEGYTDAVHDSIEETARYHAEPFTITPMERTIEWHSDEDGDYSDETESLDPYRATLDEALDLIREGGTWDSVDFRGDDVILYPADSHQDFRTGVWTSTSYAIDAERYWIDELADRLG